MRMLHSPDEAVRWLRTRVKGSLQTDSRCVRAGDAFLAWPGASHDARRFVQNARAAGAAACVLEAQALTEEAVQAWGADDAVAGYAQLKAASGPIAAAWFDHPSQSMDVFAVTGTNGKTSTAWWIAQALAALAPARRCAVVGTLGIGVPPALAHNGLTTPDAVLLQRSLRELLDSGVEACAMEASSIGLAEQRLDGTAIRVAIFTNFTQDHLDYHGSMDAYWHAKARLFDWPHLRAAVVNVDDPKGEALAAALGARDAAQRPELWTVSTRREACLRARAVRLQGTGMCMELSEGESTVPLQTTLLGDYNVSNLLGVIAALRAVGVPLMQAVRACETLAPVPGRMEQIALPGQPLVCVDYAHTPDALDKVLAALSPLAHERGGRLWCVFGCGGDRDATKRPLMAAVAQRHADCLVVTSDNPRSENPQAIISQILLGFSAPQNVQVQADRAAAIAGALAQADARDVVLIAGKGHEAVQEINGLRLPFSDLAHARDALQSRGVRP